MSCSIPGTCSHSPNCADHNCPGRGTMNDGIDDLGWCAFWVVTVILLILGAMRAYVWWRWMV